MNLSPSIDLIWKLAAQEMVTGEFSEIQPEHFCMALLKFAEISVRVNEVGGKQAGLAKAIAGEAQLVREALQKCGIESTSARRKIRKQLGKGGSHQQGKEVHRSAASRVLFESAAKLAQEAGSETVTPLHLLTALVQSPPPAIAQAVLGKSSPQPPLTALPILDKYGRDLVKQVIEEKMQVKPGLETQCKAVLQALQQKDRRCILLVADCDNVVVELASAIAFAIASQDPPEGLRGKRIIDVSLSRSVAPKGKRISRDEEAEQMELIRRLLAEAASHPEIILIVPAVETEPQQARGGEWPDLLQETLGKGKIQFICRAKPSVFMEHLRKDTVWKQRTQALWIEKAAQGSVPREL